MATPALPLHLITSLLDPILHRPAPRLLPARTLLDHINNLLHFPRSRSLMVAQTRQIGPEIPPNYRVYTR